MPWLPRRVAVGWSGGADSTALLLALRAAGHQPEAWHVDHGWRDGSADEAAVLGDIARQWGVPFRSQRLVAAGRNREAAARAGRLAQFRSWSEEAGIDTLCLAHHRNDQAETVCMRLLQGAGPGGCCGMRRERIMDGLRIVRPLLHVSARELRAALAAAGIAWLEDPSNRDMSIWRNRIRHRLFPAIAAAGYQPETLFLRWRGQAGRIAGLLDAAVDALLAHVTVAERELRMPWSLWRDCAPAVRARALQRCMALLLGDGATPGRRHILLVEAWTEKSGHGGLDLSRCRIERRGAQLYLRLHMQTATAVYRAEGDMAVG